MKSIQEYWSVYLGVQGGSRGFQCTQVCRVVYLKQNCTCKRIKLVNEAECRRSLGESGVDVKNDQRHELG